MESPTWWYLGPLKEGLRETAMPRGQYHRHKVPARAKKEMDKKASSFFVSSSLVVVSLSVQIFLLESSTAQNLVNKSRIPPH